MKLSHYFLSFLLYIILPFGATAQPLNTDDSSANYSFKQLGWDSKVTLNGYSPEATLYIPLASSLNVQKIVLHLKMAFSPNLMEGTMVALQFNGTDISKFSLPDNPGQSMQIDVELPVTNLSESWQNLHFSAVLKGNKTTCDPDIWIYISPESSISVDWLRLPFKGTLNKLPSPFTEFAALSPIPTLLLLPPSPAVEEIMSLLQIAFKLGQAVSDTTNALSSQIMNDSVDGLKNSNVIVISTLPHLENMPVQLTTMVHENGMHTDFSKGNGLLLLQPSPFNPLRGLLIISGSDESALYKATEGFLNKEIKALTFGKLAIIHQIDEPADNDVIGDIYDKTLKDSGYTDTNVSGLGRHSLRFNIALPTAKIPANTRVETFITTPIANTSGSSQLTVLVNDHKQASYWLKENHSSFETEIDPSAMKPGLNKLEYLIDLHFEDPKQEQCTRANFDTVWATIYAQTRIKTGFSSEFPESMLNQLPVPFAHDITVVLPDPLIQEDINLFSLFFFKLGQLAKPFAMQVHIRTSNQVDEDFIRNHDVIILGTAKTNPWIPFALERMPVSLKGDSRSIMVDEKHLQVSGESSTGLLELAPSPWSENHTLLLITGDNQTGFHNAIISLINDKLRNTMEGNIAFINQDKSVENLNSYAHQYMSIGKRINLYISNMGKNIYYYLLNHPQIFIYLLVFIIPLIIVMRNRKK